MKDAIAPRRYETFSFHVDKRLMARKCNDWKMREEAARKRRHQIIMQRKENAATFHNQFLTASSQYFDSIIVIQRWWKRRQIRVIRLQRLFFPKFITYLNELLKLKTGTHSKINLEEKKNFEKLMSALCQSNVITKMKFVLHTICQHRRHRPYNEIECKKLLTSFAISGFPHFVLGRVEPLSEGDRLQKIASHLLTSLSKLSKAITEKDKATAVKQLYLIRETRKLFLKTFDEWKAVDSQKLLQELTASFQRIRTEHEKVQEEVRLQQSMNIPINEGLHQFMKGFRDQMKGIKKRILQLIGEKEFKIWESRVEATQQAEIPSFRPSWKEIQVYEMMRDPNYKIQPKKNNSKEHSHNIHKELQSQVKAGDLSSFLQILENIRQRIISLTPNRDDINDETNSILDLEFLKQRIDSNAFTTKDFIEIITFVFERIVMLQAPARNAATREKTKQLEQISEKTKDWRDIIGVGLDNVLQELSDIETDMSNFKLRILAQHLQEQDFSLESKTENEIKGVSYILQSWTQRGQLEKVKILLARQANEWDTTTTTEFIKALYTSLTSEKTPTLIQIFEEERYLGIKKAFSRLVTLATSEFYWCKIMLNTDKSVRKLLREHKQPATLLKKLFERNNKFFDQNEFEKIQRMCNSKLLDILQVETLDLKKTIFFPHSEEILKLKQELKTMLDMTLAMFNGLLQNILLSVSSSRPTFEN